MAVAVAVAVAVMAVAAVAAVARVHLCLCLASGLGHLEKAALGVAAHAWAWCNVALGQEDAAVAAVVAVVGEVDRRQHGPSSVISQDNPSCKANTCSVE